MGIEEANVVHTPRVTLKERLLVTKEKVLHGRSVSDDPSDIKIGFEKLQTIRDELRGLEKALQSWLSSGKSLAKSSAELAKKMPVEQRTYTELSSGMATDLRNDEALRDIARKIEAIDALMKDRKVMQDLHYLKHRRERKLDSAKQDASRARRAALDGVAKTEYDALCDELRAALGAIVDDADKDGLGALVGKELSAFKTFQHEFFAHAERATGQEGVESPADSAAALATDAELVSATGGPLVPALQGEDQLRDIESEHQDRAVPDPVLEAPLFEGDVGEARGEQPKIEDSPPLLLRDGPTPAVSGTTAGSRTVTKNAKDSNEAWQKLALLVLALLVALLAVFLGVRHFQKPSAGPLVPRQDL